MSPPVLNRDVDGCPVDGTVRTCLRMLAQRGARLVVFANGATVEAERRGSVQAIAWIEAAFVPALDAAGWLTDIGDGRFVLSPVGRNVVRLIKAAPAPAAGIAAAASTVPPPAVVPALRPAAAPDGTLAWLRARRGKDNKPLLSAEAFQAGERLCLEFHRAGMSPRITSNYESIPRSADERRCMAGTAGDIHDGAATAQQRVRRALTAVPPELAGLVMDVCCFGLGLQEAERSYGMPQRSGHFLLEIALRALARHYGLLPPADHSWQPRAGTRHWGAEGYRPKV
jgi:hypothetical protein